MKKVFFSFLALFALGLIVLNFSLKREANGSNGFALSNIHALQASAGEAWCDGSSSTTCTITVKGVLVAQGTGQPHITN